MTHFQQNSGLPEHLLEHGREFVSRPASYSFTPNEKAALRQFFTNTAQRVFFIHNLPGNIIAVLLAMYSRLKNERGLRGVFVDSFLPQILVSLAPEIAETDGDAAKLLKNYGITKWDEFLASRFGNLGRDFLQRVRIDTDYMQQLADANKLKKFLGTWLDSYGHNSIARTATIHFCLEGISILAAKSVEWTRPASGYIELSTRYVDMGGTDVYPIARELDLLGFSNPGVEEAIRTSYDFYRDFQGEKFDGPFPAFLRNTYGHLYPQGSKDLDIGIRGEAGDVLGNFLPAATLTSVGVSVSGEAFPEIIKHLVLDATPETIALAEAIVEESKKTGAHQFARHIDPTVWKQASWGYLDPAHPDFGGEQSGLAPISLLKASVPLREFTEAHLLESFQRQQGYQDCRTFEEVIWKLKAIERGDYDKLPNHFEFPSAAFAGRMSFRSWRDFHRHGFLTHYRTLLTPRLGFYLYDKKAPQELCDAFRKIHAVNMALYDAMERAGIPPALAQYPMAIGNMIGFVASGNLSQWEFCSWQRTKYSVNHEVRQAFLQIHKHLRNAYPWWSDVSRADTTPAYLFARVDKEDAVIKFDLAA